MQLPEGPTFSGKGLPLGTHPLHCWHLESRECLDLPESFHLPVPVDLHINCPKTGFTTYTFVQIRSKTQALCPLQPPCPAGHDPVHEHCVWVKTLTFYEKERGFLYLQPPWFSRMLLPAAQGWVSLIRLSCWQCSSFQTWPSSLPPYQYLLNTWNMPGSVLGTMDRNKNRSRCNRFKSSQWWERRTSKSNLCSVPWMPPGLDPESHGRTEKVDGYTGRRAGMEESSRRWYLSWDLKAHWSRLTRGTDDPGHT